MIKDLDELLRLATQIAAADLNLDVIPIFHRTPLMFGSQCATELGEDKLVPHIASRRAI